MIPKISELSNEMNEMSHSTTETYLNETNLSQENDTENESSICILFNGVDCTVPRKSAEMLPNLAKFTIYNEVSGIWKGWAFTSPITMKNRTNDSQTEKETEMKSNESSMSLNYIMVAEQKIQYSENADQNQAFLTIPLKYMTWPCCKSEYPCTASQYLDSLNSPEKKANYTSLLLSLISSLPDQNITIENCLVYKVKEPISRAEASELICLKSKNDLENLQKAISQGFKDAYKNINIVKDVELLCENERAFKVIVKAGEQNNIASSIAFRKNGLVFTENNESFIDFNLINKNQFPSTCGLEENPISNNEIISQVIF